MDKIYEGVEMEIKKVEGSYPEEFEKLRGGTFINLYPEKIVTDDESDNYEYYQQFVYELRMDKLEEIARKMEEQILREEKHEALKTLVVTTKNGNVFDANLDARVNMNSAISASETSGKTESAWKLADNTVKTITLEELKEAHALAILAVGEIVTKG